MANKMLFDDTRALRREQREARIARKRERREARGLKRQHQTTGLETLALETLDIPPSRPQAEEPLPGADTAAPEPGNSPVTPAAENSASPQTVASPVDQAESSPAIAVPLISGRLILPTNVHGNPVLSRMSAKT